MSTSESILEAKSMIYNLKPYPAYKDSGIPWLEEIPNTWRVLRGKNVFRVIDVRSETGNEELLTVSSKDGVVPRSQKTVTMFKAESYIGHKLCWPGDLVINSLWAWMQGLGFTKYHGLVSSAYSVYRPLPEFSSYANYFDYILRSAAYKWELQTRSKGVWLSRLQLSDLAFLDMPIIIPPIDEQSVIVRYLDHFDRRIRHYIRAKKKLIKLLEEQKQAIIHQAVTRGLDPNVKFKPSGIEWLGEIPEQWEVKPAKWYYREVDERSSTGSEEMLSVSHITGVTPRSEKNITMFMAESYVGHKLCREGDLVINTMWAWMAALGIARQTGIVSPSYAVYRPIQKNTFLPQFIDLLLRIKPYVAEYVCRSTGIRSSRLRLYPEKFLSIPIIHPPIAEQQAIFDKIYEATSELETAIHTYNQGISLLREYRTRLIADVVTGKLDVREAVANLSDKSDEIEVEDDFEEETIEENLEEVATEEMVEGEV